MKSYSIGKFLKVFFCVLLLVGFVKFLRSDAVENGGRKTNNGLNGPVGAMSKFDLNYASKRRVPNGPDPIHNRYSM